MPNPDRDKNQAKAPIEPLKLPPYSKFPKRSILHPVLHMPIRLFMLSKKPFSLVASQATTISDICTWNPSLIRP
jgi:hypothetical protein